MQAPGVAENIGSVRREHDAASDANVADRSGARPATDAVVPMKAALVRAPDNLAQTGRTVRPVEAYLFRRGARRRGPPGKPARRDLERLQALRLEESVKR